jgi:hypothetical protein
MPKGGIVAEVELAKTGATPPRVEEHTPKQPTSG